MADLRKCIGSTRFGIEPHEAPIDEFPQQPSQKDGLGRMCKVHWNQYTAGLARDAKARKAAGTAKAADGAPDPEPVITKATQAKDTTAEPSADRTDGPTTKTLRT